MGMDGCLGAGEVSVGSVLGCGLDSPRAHTARVRTKHACALTARTLAGVAGVLGHLVHIRLGDVERARGRTGPVSRPGAYVCGGGRHAACMRTGQASPPSAWARCCAAPSAGRRNQGAG